MTLATILILAGAACLLAGAALPVVYALRLRLQLQRGQRVTGPARTRLAGAAGAVGPR